MKCARFTEEQIISIPKRKYARCGMYERRSRLGTRQQSEPIRLFVVGSTARAAGEIVGVHRNTAASYFMRPRRLIARICPVSVYLARLKPMKAVSMGCEKENADVELPGR